MLFVSSEMTCRALPAVRDGSVHPLSCLADDVLFGTTCSVTCHPGYSIEGPYSRQCLPEGVWTPAAEASQCVGKRQVFTVHFQHFKNTLYS